MLRVAVPRHVALEDVRSAKWLEATRAPVAADGTLPWFQ